MVALFLSLGLKLLQSIASAIGMMFGRKVASEIGEQDGRLAHYAARFTRHSASRNNVSGESGRASESSSAGDLDDNGLGLGISGSKHQ